MKSKLSIVLIAACLLSCKDNLNDKSKRNQNWAWWIDATTGKASWVHVNEGDPVKNGKYTLFYFNGNVYQKGKRVDGKDVDTIFYFDVNGGLAEYEVIKADTTLQYYVKNGPARLFFSDGKTTAIGVIKDHQIGDKWQHYLHNGHPDYIKNINNGTGWLTWYYDNGKVKDSDYYEDEKSFNITHWNENGHLKSSDEFKDHNLNGLHKEFYDDGNIEVTGYTVNGKRNGEEKFWYEDGKLQATKYQINGIPNGPQTTYSENGKIELTGNYLNGKADGDFKKYDENGKVVRELVFKDGALIKNKTSDSLKNDDLFNKH